MVESDVRSRMQPLKDQLTKTISHLHTVFETHVFIAICRGYWDRMGQASVNLKMNSMEKFLVLLLFLDFHIIISLSIIVNIFSFTQNVLSINVTTNISITSINTIVCVVFMQDVLSFLENRKENRSWYKGSRVAVSVSSRLKHQYSSRKLNDMICYPYDCRNR